MLDKVLGYIVIELVWIILGGGLYALVDSILQVKITGKLNAKSLSTSMRVAWGGLNVALLITFVLWVNK